MLYAVIIGQVQLWPWLWVELTGSRQPWNLWPC